MPFCTKPPKIEFSGNFQIRKINGKKTISELDFSNLKKSTRHQKVFIKRQISNRLEPPFLEI